MNATATFATSIRAIRAAAESELQHGNDFKIEEIENGVKVVGEAQAVMYLIGAVAATGSDGLTSYELGEK